MANASWLAPACGILFPILFIVAMTLEPQDPPEGTDDAAWADYYLDAGVGGRAGFYVEGVAWLLFVVFLGGLGARLAEREADRTWSRTATGAGLLIVALGLVSFVGRWVLVWEDTHQDAPSRTFALFASNLHNAAFTFQFTLFVLLAGAAGASMLATRSFPRWLGWTSVVFAAENLLHSLEGIWVEAPWVGVLHNVGFLMFLLWPILVGGTWLAGLRPRAEAPPAVA